jgi:hypothetical protein
MAGHPSSTRSTFRAAEPRYIHPGSYTIVAPDPGFGPRTVALIKRTSRKQSICLQTLKVGANDRSAQELQNGL